MKRVFQLIFLITFLVLGLNGFSQTTDSNKSNHLNRIPDDGDGFLGSPVVTYAKGTGGNSFWLHWRIALGATAYEIYISKSSTFDSFVPGYNGKYVSASGLYIVGGTTAHYTVYNMDTRTNYYVKVKALNGSTSRESNVRIVTVGPFDPPEALPPTNITQTSFKLNWQAQENADYYLLNLTKGIPTDPKGAIFRDKIVRGTSLIFDQADGGTSYFYSLRAVYYGPNTSVYSSNQQLVRTQPADADFYLRTSDVQADRITIRWPAHATVQLEVSERSDFATTVFNGNVTGISKTVTGLKSGTAYFFRAMVDDLHFGEKTATFERFTLTNAPTGLTVSNKTTNSFKLSWNAVTRSAGYAVYVTFSNGQTRVHTTTSTAYTLVDLYPGGIHSYYVRSKNQAPTHLAAYSANSSVGTTDLPGGVYSPQITEISFPLNASLFRWTAISGSKGYTYQITDQSGTIRYNGQTSETNLMVSNYTLGLEENATYYFMVKTKFSVNYGSYTGHFSSGFTSQSFYYTGEFTGLGGDGFGANFQVYPNPTPGKLHFKIGSKQINPDDVNYELFDAHGYIIDEGKLPQAEIDLSSIRNGTYVIKFYHGKKLIATERVVRQ